MVCPGPPSTDPAPALGRLLEATQALEAALMPLDVEGFEQALATRAEALDDFIAQASQTQGPLPVSVRDLAEAAAEADRRVRGQAALVLTALRDELRSLDNGRQGLMGYRPPAPNLPRFADRRG